jgi:hypothetical protein
LQRQNSKLDSRNLVKAAKKPNNKASKQPKPRALKEPVASADTDEDADSDFPSDPDGRMSAFTKDVWDGYYGEDPWGDGRDGPEGRFGLLGRLIDGCWCWPPTAAGLLPSNQ